MWRSELFCAALADGFVEEQGGGGGDVERVYLAEHGDPHAFIGLVHPSVAQPELFGSDHEGDSLFHVALCIFPFGVRGGGQGADVARAEPGEGFIGGGFHHGEAEEGADAGSHDVGVVDVGAAIADDDGVHACGICGAKE